MSATRREIRDALPDLDVDFQIIDAKTALKVSTTVADARGAVPLDPYNCLFARACRRKHLHALFFRTTAYVRKSHKTVEKYSVPPSGQAQIKFLDISGQAVSGVGITLTPPTKGKRVGDGSRTKRPGGSTGKDATPEARAARVAARAEAAKYQRHLSDVGWSA